MPKQNHFDLMNEISYLNTINKEILNECQPFSRLLKDSSTTHPFPTLPSYPG